MSYAKGLAGESKAAKHYEKLGFRVLGRRVKTLAGEIDLILYDPTKRSLVFCEVKMRQDLTSAAYALAPAQQKRLLRAADVWVADKQEYKGFKMQFDAFLINGKGETRRIENAFRLT